MNSNNLKNLRDEFLVLAEELLNSNESTFKSNLVGFTEFCNSNKAILDILKPIIETKFNGIQYFDKKSNPGEKFNKYPQPQNRWEMLKFSYDVLWEPELKANHVYNYAIWALHPNTKKIDELLRIGTGEISTKLINHINIELKKLITSLQSETNSNQINFNIQNAPNSIIGTQATATINNSYNLDELKSLVEQNACEDKESLKELIELLKTITQNNVPISRGTLAKFSEAIEKHSWIAGSIASSLIGWLIGK